MSPNQPINDTLWLACFIPPTTAFACSLAWPPNIAGHVHTLSHTDFGYVLDDQPILPATWQSAFDSVSSIRGMLGGLLIIGLTPIGWGEYFFSLHILMFSFAHASVTDNTAIAIACGVFIVGVLAQFLTPKHANGMGSPLVRRLALKLLAC